MEKGEEYILRGKLSVQELFKKAEELIKNEHDSEAYKIYQSILEFDSSNIYCLFRLGEICNRANEIDKSIYYHTKSFESDARFAEKMTPNDHVSHNYIYKKVPEIIVDNCPICGGKGKTHSCFNDVTNVDFTEGFNPIRIWMYCSDCDHIFTKSYPKELYKALSNSQGIFHMKPIIELLPNIAEVLKGILKYSKGKKLLDVGVGAGELAAVAKEYQLNVTGIDIRKVYADQVSKSLNIKVHNIDFMEYNSKGKYDVICMGDVIEHLIDPVSAVKKINTLLDDSGVFWVSTPNFRSAYSLIMKDNDPMWRVCEHLNYFSFDSLGKLLCDNGFEIVDYRSSSHYYGSMEVIAVKKSNISKQDSQKKDMSKLYTATKLNIGCGKDIKEGFINIDCIQNDGVDIIADLDNCVNSPLPFDENSISEIYASHIIEYIKDPLSLMQELHRVSKPNAKAVFKCFYGSSDEASEDPAHARLYFMNSFGYFSQPFYWRADYGYRGDWKVETINLVVDVDRVSGMSETEILETVNSRRNIVKEMCVELTAIKPLRNPDKLLQTYPQIRIEYTQPLNPYLKYFHTCKTLYMDYPKEVHIETTGICNAKCVFCPHEILQRKSTNMSDSTFNKIISDLKAIPSDHKFWISPFKVNEPLCDKKFFDRMNIINKELPNAMIRFFSNFNMATDEHIEKLLKVKNLDSIWISLNSVENEEYKMIMGLELEKTIINIRKLLESLRSSQTAKMVTISRVKMGNEYDNEFISKLMELFKGYEGLINPILIDKTEWIDFISIDGKNKVFDPCARWFELSITCTGEVSLCCMDGNCKYSIGDVNDENLLNIYNSPKYKPLRSNFNSRRNVTPCERCTDG